MIAQGFGFTGNFLKERNNSAYFRLKISGGNDDRMRAPISALGIHILPIGD